MAALTALERAANEVTDAAEMRALIDRISVETRRIAATRWHPYPWQRPHVHPADWRGGLCGPDCFPFAPAAAGTHGMWLLLGGRGTGKTEAAARYMDRHAQGEPCDPRLPGGHRMLIVAPTQGDAVEACVRGPSGLTTINPTVRMVGGSGGIHVRWPNRSSARVLGAFTPEDVERLRAAGNTCLIWLEEVAAMRQLDDALRHTRLGLRIGTRPHYVASTTPKPRATIKALMERPTTILTSGRTADAHGLDPTVRDSYFDTYAGTRIGRQELDAELLEDTEGALWTILLIDASRVDQPPVQFDRIVVGLDPPGSEDGAEAGIVVVGVAGRDAYVLADVSGHMSPEGWASASLAAYHRFSADAIVVERNFGGDMVKHTLRTQRAADGVSIREVVAKRGKALRAEPVVSLYEQERVHHVGALPVLEGQMTEWVPGEGDSPDRVDALVHAVTNLLVANGPTILSNPARSARRFRPSSATA